MKIDDLSRRERQIMRLLFRAGRATVSEVHADLEDPPGYDSVRTTLRILEGKGFVRHERDGQRYVYLPAISRDRALREELGGLTSTFFGGSFGAAALALLRLSDDEASDEALRELAKLLDETGEPTEETS